MSNPKVRFHEAANLLPLLGKEERAAFKEDLRVKGILDPVTYWMDHKGRKWLIDGRNRFLVGMELRQEGAEINGEPFPIPETEFKGTEQEVLAFVLSRNMQGRRHLSSGQKAACAIKANLLAARYKQKEEGGTQTTDGEGDLAQMIADMVGTNRTYIFRCQKLLTFDPNLLERVIAGELSIPQALHEMKQAQQMAALVQDTPADGEAAEEQEEPADAIVKDGNGEPVPEQFHPVFNAILDPGGFKETTSVLRKMRSQVEALCAGPAGKWLIERELVAHLTNAIREVNAGKPHAVCPECVGEGKIAVPGKKRKSKCERCEGAGWLNRSRYEGAPTVADEDGEEILAPVQPEQTVLVDANEPEDFGPQGDDFPDDNIGEPTDEQGGSVTPEQEVEQDEPALAK